MPTIQNVQNGSGLCCGKENAQAIGDQLEIPNYQATSRQTESVAGWNC